MNTKKIFLIFGLFSFISLSGYATQTLPYSNRELPYNALHSNLRGDIRLIGMAGVTTGLADSFIATHDNPAGLAMTLSGGGLSFSGNTVQDGQLQAFGSSVSNYFIGAYSAHYPWGWAASISNPYSEGARYVLPATGETAKVSILTTEYRVSLARVFWNHRLSIGLSGIFGQGTRKAEFEPDVNTGMQSPDLRSTTFTGGAAFGMMAQLPRRWFLGIGLTSPMKYSGRLNIITTAMPFFFQPIYVPWKASIGSGWIPNRIFRFGFGLHFFGISPHRTALLADQNVTVGSAIQMQPRIGAFYRAIEFKELVAEVTLGSYLEMSRQSGGALRPHVTAGVEILPWLFTFGCGIDFSSQYKNYILSIGVDVGKVMSKLELIPTPWHPPYAGFFPKPNRFYSDGLPRPINPAWKSVGPSMNVIDIGKDMPARVKEKIEELGDAITGETQAEVAEKKKTARKKKTKRP